jgi:hypothetical protein
VLICSNWLPATISAWIGKILLLLKQAALQNFDRMTGFAGMDYWAFPISHLSTRSSLLLNRYYLLRVFLRLVP